MKVFGTGWLDRWEHAHHGMVRLPHGKMRSREGSFVSADPLLDHLTDDLLAEWAKEDETATTPAHRETCDRLAVGLVKYHFLRARRLKDIPYEEEMLLARGLPAFATIVSTLAGAEQAARTDAGGAPLDESPATRAVLLLLDDLPRIAHQALARLEPADVARWLDELCLRVQAARRRGRDLPGDVASAVAVGLRRGLALLNVDLPASLDALPPIFS
jgi:arginyl-tRNA synthetase